MKKSKAFACPPDSAERVLAHAKYQSSRGRKPSMAFRGILNPVVALKVAMESQAAETVKVILVWREHQTTKASAYGETHFGTGKFRVLACKDPNVKLAELGEDNAMIYYHPA